MSEVAPHDAGPRDLDPRTIGALADADALTGAACRACGRALCGHEAVFSLILGYKRAPHCLPCLAAHRAEDLPGLRERSLQYIHHHDCFTAAWNEASAREGFADQDRPPCVFELDTPHASSATEAPAGPADVLRWDAGDMACGDLVFELRLRMRELAPGALLHLRATDPGAPTDLPAWCRLTGHTLVAAEHPEYRMRRRP